MTPNASIGHGAVIRIGRGATPVWTTLTGAQDFDEPDQAAADVDATAHDSPNGTEESVPGLLPAVDWSVTVQHVPENAVDVLMRDLKATGETVLIEITPRGADAEITWTGYVKNWRPSYPIKGLMMAVLTMRVMAKVVA